jgi:aryl-alcohol dehydrogenase-like predicted oxidoreductase
MSEARALLESVRRSGTYNLGEWNVRRLGYGAMRLSGPMIYGPPADPAHAAEILRTVIASGVNHIDTSDYYGPHFTNQLIRETLAPYPDDLVLVTKVGARRNPDKSWPTALSKQELISAVHDNLRNLGLEALHVVNLRVGTGMFGPLPDQSIAEPFGVLADLRQQGLIRHLGISNATPQQLTQAQAIAPVVCVQNSYNLAQRADDAFIDNCAEQGIAFVPFFPLGGMKPLQHAILDSIASELGATPMQVALAWLLQRSPNILLIPGTSSLQHVKENLAAADFTLSANMLETLDNFASHAE